MRRTGVFKTPPALRSDYMGRFAKIAKAKWYDLYADLYRQTHEETATDAEIMIDAEIRLKVLTTPDDKGEIR